MISTSLPLYISLVHRLFYGPMRRPFRGLLRRFIQKQTERRILLGPLRGMRWLAEEMSCTLGVYELDVTEHILRYVKPGGVFYDIGANRGFFALLAAHLVGQQGHVFAFEPFPDNLAQMEKLFALNQLSNVTLVPKAVSDHSGQAEIFVQTSGTEKDGVMASLQPKPGDQALPIELVRLDEFIATHPAPSFVKMDIEGAEVLALQGAQRLLQQAVPAIWLIECHSDQLESDAANLLRSYGYDTRIIFPKFKTRRSVDRHLLAWKP